MMKFIQCTILAAVVPIVTMAHAANWSSSDKWGSWSDGGYTVRNDVWGSGAGPQTIWANSYSNWGVWADHPNTGGVKAYPHSAKNINKRLSAIASLNSSFNVTVPGGGAYASTYDIWANNNAYEIMLWMNWTGAVGPIGSKQATVSVGGHTWDVYRGSNGSNEVFSFLRQGDTHSGTVDIDAVLNWIRGRGWFGDVTVGEVQFGFEITSSSGGMDFRSNSYSVTSS
ncbi:hypothetical protein LVJ94_32165 [Pendulispora rubella]|uniref:Glycosyl hydrolase family 12 n=1 Tax=Pendulispora rubella TaxID=2741070 RepID=A0ABZ2KSD2_9BACT